MIDQDTHGIDGNEIQLPNEGNTRSRAGAAYDIAYTQAIEGLRGEIEAKFGSVAKYCRASKNRPSKHALSRNFTGVKDMSVATFLGIVDELGTLATPIPPCPAHAGNMSLRDYMQISHHHVMLATMLLGMELRIEK